jgi:sugar transferase (PEP-CTERM system associated)
MFRIDSERLQISNKLLLFTADACVILLSVTIAAKFPMSSEGATWTYLLRPDILIKLLFVIVIFGLGLQYSGLYSFSLTTKRRELFVRSFRGLGVAYLVLALLYAWHPHFSLGGKATGVAVSLIVVSVLSLRLALGSTRTIRSRMERVLVLGTGEVGRELAKAVRSADDLDIEIVGFLDDGSASSSFSYPDSEIIGQAPDLEVLVRRERIDRVLISLAERRGRMPLDQLLRVKMAGVKVEDAHSMYERITGRIRLEQLTPSWLFMSRGFRNAGFWLTIKYALDSIVSVIILTVFAPVMALVALAIWLGSGFPIMFIQNRVGRNGEHFRMLKFRSMANKADGSQARWATDEDARITSVGRFIRKYRLDELPQLFNVLRGDMSLVGPRPEQPYFCEMLGRQVPYFAERHSVRPGITGWAQVKYRYGATVEESRTKLEYDLFYLKHMSPLLDVVILFCTINVLLSGKGAK